MKKALSCKLILLFIAFALSIALAFSFYGVKTAHAADITGDNIATYFYGAQSVKLEDDNLIATVKDGNSVSVLNSLVADDLAFDLVVPNSVKEFTVKLSYDSYFTNGAYNSTTKKFDKTVKNEFTFNAKGNLTVLITTADNAVSVKVGNNTQAKDDIYYKIKGDDKCSAKVSFAFALTEGTESADITFKSVDQKSSDRTGAYKQTFALDENNKIAEKATPRVIINNLPFLKLENGGYKAIYGDKYTLSFTTYSVFGDVSSSSVYVDKDSVSDSVWVDPSSETPKSVIFEEDSEFTLRTADKENIESYFVAVSERENDTNAPVYIDFEDNAEIYGWYKTLVENASKKDYDGYGELSIRLGDSYEIPSLQDLVKDDCDLYSSLKYTVYYRTPSNASGQTSSMSFTVSEAGDYEFFVVFKDSNGNSMEKDDFYTVDEEDEDIRTFGEYGFAVFTFTIEDNAPISVEVPEQDKGYLNTQYVAAGFKILSGNNETFTLYYNPDKNATADSTGWVELPKLADIKEDYNENGFTYADIKGIDYDGKYTFTPVKVGAYKIKCFVSSGSSAARYAEGETVVSVADKPNEVVVPSTWLRDNVWSVVFLSIGTLALIGIVVLLFIKPKEEAETDETGDALKEKAQK